MNYLNQKNKIFLKKMILIMIFLFRNNNFYKGNNFLKKKLNNKKFYTKLINVNYLNIIVDNV
jgi:hypothetical protein